MSDEPESKPVSSEPWQLLEEAPSPITCIDTLTGLLDVLNRGKGHGGASKLRGQVIAKLGELVAMIQVVEESSPLTLRDPDESDPPTAA